MTLFARVPGLQLAAPLRERRFALYLAGQLLSQIGDGIYLVTLPFIVLDQGGGPTNLGVVLACYGTARLAFLPVGGALADRLGARPVMLAADALRGLAVLGFAVLTANEHIPLWAMITVAVPFGALGGIFMPASFAVLPHIVRPESLAAGNSLIQIMQSTSRIAGPALGGMLVASLKSGVGLLIDAITFLVSSLTLMAIRPPEPAAGAADDTVVQDADDTDRLRTWRSVLRYAAAAPLVRMTLLTTLVFNLAAVGLIEIALPVFAQDSLGRGAFGFGVMMAGLGAGSVVGALLGPALLRLRRRGLVALCLGIAEGLALAGVPVGSSLVMATAAMFTAASLQATVNVFYMTMLQRTVPARALGRVMSLLATCAGLAYPASALLAGTALAKGAPEVVIVVAGLGVSAAFSVGFFSRPYRNL
ncbi:MFS transporter [Lentzea flaviverrucosa]|uniref:Predicted arabinose efflux permease, MFS family n=1 Tax=Lentzea flaviverrucosa TaxID=200379 RepID=A0A1H9SD82_9PSEU|nr:MFS transporter [Lentzea flaviverrucosa]RDI25325.1 putative MFS family arabinose efflux permease [Lentzea flaviverrucosa]SER82937.1 Predicted arabinose efflux permease, MFS family [Lentzea flaviverrucosa]